MNKQKKFEVVLDECINRVITQNVPIDYVVNDYPQWKDMLKSEIETALWLHNEGDHLSVRTGFISATKQYLLSQLLVINLQKKFRYRAYRERGLLTRYALSAIIVLLLFLGGGGVAVAAEDSLPGNVLYTVKLSKEDIRLALTLQPSKDAKLHLQYANDHLVDCAILASDGRIEDAKRALLNYEHHIANAGRLVPVLSQDGNLDGEALFMDFNRIYLRDTETIKVLLPGEY